MSNRGAQQGLLRPSCTSRIPLLMVVIGLLYSLSLVLRLETGKSYPTEGSGMVSDTTSVDNKQHVFDGTGYVDAHDRPRVVVEEGEHTESDAIPRFSWDTERTPVKGGVEVYPLQPARRPRQARPPVVPEVREVEGTLSAWKLPPIYDTYGGQAIKGLYVLFHGCNHGPLDWFDLPEERTIVDFLVRKNYAVIAPASKNRDSGCWNTEEGGLDSNSVRGVLWRWYRDWSIPPNTPLFLLGASSGGTMATALGSEGGFQLCEKRSTYVKVSGILSQVSWGVKAERFGAKLPPVAFMPMPKDDRQSATDEFADVPPIFGNSRKIPPQVAAVAHSVRKQRGRPRMLLLPLGELSIYKEFFSDRLYEVSVEQSTKLHGALLAADAMECDPQRYTDGEMECSLTHNPRDRPAVLNALVSTYRSTLSDESAADGVEEGRAEEVSLPSLPGRAPSNDNGTRGTLSKEHATEAFRELLNVAWGEHEISADFVPLWEQWLWDSCADTCRPEQF